MIPQTAPPSKAAKNMTVRRRTLGKSLKERPIMVAQSPPISICPAAPILNNPVLKAKATERPVRMRVVAIAKTFPILSML